MTDLENKLRGLVLKSFAERGTYYTYIRYKNENNPFPMCWVNLCALVTKKGISLKQQQKLCTFFGMECELVEIKKTDND